MPRQVITSTTPATIPARPGTQEAVYHRSRRRKNADPNHAWLAAIVKKESNLEMHRLIEFCATPSEEEVAGIGHFAIA